MFQPFTTQPQPARVPIYNAGVGWMPVPRVNAACPPGLEYLTQIDKLTVYHNAEILNSMTGYEYSNKYLIKNRTGQQVYYVAEDINCCTKMWCGNLRPFRIDILDKNLQEVIRIHRPCRCIGCCYPCCPQAVEVMTPSGTTIGYVKQEWSLFKPQYAIKNAAEDTVLKIDGPCCPVRCFCDLDFSIYSRGQLEVGKMSKKWHGMLKEIFEDTDYFEITFPMDLDVNTKALCLGALFLIDFMYYEKQGGGNGGFTITSGS